MASRVASWKDAMSDDKPYLTTDDIASLNEIRPSDLIRNIAREVEAQTGIPQMDIFSDSRRADHVRARDVICYIARRHGVSYPKIARAMQRDHSSIMAAVRREEARRGA
jgi:chromosomal replication initiation ATPase DnaA